MTKTEFEWPCDREDAHGSHPYNHADDGSQCYPLTCGGSRHDPCFNDQECPGVKAHPLTQIGKGELPELPKR